MSVKKLLKNKISAKTSLAIIFSWLVVITFISLPPASNNLKTDMLNPGASIIPFKCAKVTSASSNNAGGNSPGNLNYGISLWYGVGTVTPYSHLGPTGQELATISDSNVFEQRYIGTQTDVLAVGASDAIGQQQITAVCDTGTINIYTPALSNVSTNMRLYVASDGSTYHSRADHNYSTWPNGPDLTATQALVPEHLAKSSPTYQADCYNYSQVTYGDWSCDGPSRKTRLKTTLGKNYNATSNVCEGSPQDQIWQTENCATDMVCSSGACIPASALSGGLYENTTWTLARSPYTVTADVTLFPGINLTIEPGVQIKFNAGTKLIIRGNLISEGASDKHIVFTANSTTPAKNSWGGISIANTLGGKASFKFTDISYAQTGLSVECCSTGGPVTVSDSIFQNNTTGVGGYASWVLPISNSIFTNNTYAITQADKLITNCNFYDNTYGLYQTERISVTGSTFNRHTIALYGGRGTVTKSSIANNETGVKSFFEGFTLTANTITNNSIGVLTGNYSNQSNPINYNNIYGNSVFNIKHTVANTIDAKNNWWGSTNTTAIGSTIFDGRDDTSLGLVIIDPIVTSLIDINNPPNSTPVTNSDSLGLNSVSSSLTSSSSGLSSGSSGLSSGNSGLSSGNSGLSSGNSGFNSGASGLNSGNSNLNSGNSGLNNQSTGGNGNSSATSVTNSGASGQAAGNSSNNQNQNTSNLPNPPANSGNSSLQSGATTSGQSGYQKNTTGANSSGQTGFNQNQSKNSANDKNYYGNDESEDSLNDTNNYNEQNQQPGKKDICDSQCRLLLQNTYGQEIAKKLEALTAETKNLQKAIDDMVSKVTASVMEESMKYIDHKIMQVMVANFDKFGDKGSKLLETNNIVLGQVTAVNVEAISNKFSAEKTELKNLQESFELGVVGDATLGNQIASAWENLDNLLADEGTTRQEIKNQIEMLKNLEKQAELAKYKNGFGYKDVPYIFDKNYNPADTQNFWFNESVINVTQAGLVSGYEVNGEPTYEFGPSNKLLRAEVAKVALLLFGYEVTPAVSGSWEIPYVEKAKELGLSIAYQPALEPVTRGEMMNLIYELGKKKNIMTEPAEFVKHLDVTDLDKYWPASQTLYQAGLIKGQAGKYADLYGQLNRAEMAKIIGGTKQWLEAENQ